jgi:hypothetical protein
MLLYLFILRRFAMVRFTRSALVAGAALGLLAAPALASDDENAQNTELSEGEKELAKLLEGRVAGEPQSCIRNFSTQRMRTIEDTAYVFGRGRTIYVQRTRDPESIDDDDVLVMQLWGSQICRLDQITTIDRFSGFFSGVVFFEDFVPYTRVDDDDSED